MVIVSYAIVAVVTLLALAYVAVHLFVFAVLAQICYILIHKKYTNWKKD